MHTRVDLALSLLRPEPSKLDALVDRVRILLETKPGSLPYAKRLGCDLDSLSHGAVTPSRLAETQARIDGVLARGLPDGALGGTEVRVIDVAAGTAAGGPVPFAERALASNGARATLAVRVQLNTESGPVTLDANLAP
jgi:hypothetical protein